MIRCEAEKRRTTSRWAPGALALLALVLPALPAAGQESAWTVRGEGMWLKPTGDEAGEVFETPVPVSEDDTRQRMSSDAGLGLGVEYRTGRRLGIELALLAGDIGGEVRLDTADGPLRGSADISYTAVTLGLNFHFRPDSRADLYAGLFLHDSTYDDPTYRFPEAGLTAVWRIEEDDGYGYRVGVDLPVGTDRRWRVALGARHFRGPLDVKPILVSVGAGYRF